MTQGRERFEKWIKDWGPDFEIEPADPDCGTYAAIDTEDIWHGYKAGYLAGMEEAAPGWRDIYENFIGLVDEYHGSDLADPDCYVCKLRAKAASAIGESRGK